MTPNWQSFVPDFVADQLRQQPDGTASGQGKRIEAVALFADVSGFTQISEALGKTGRSGAEELTSILNSYFDPMIEIIE